MEGSYPEMSRITEIPMTRMPYVWSVGQLLF